MLQLQAKLNEEIVWSYSMFCWCSFVVNLVCCLLQLLSQRRCCSTVEQVCVMLYSPPTPPPLNQKRSLSGHWWDATLVMPTFWFDNYLIKAVFNRYISQLLLPHYRLIVLVYMEAHLHLTICYLPLLHRRSWAAGHDHCRCVPGQHWPGADQQVQRKQGALLPDFPCHVQFAQRPKVVNPHPTHHVQWLWAELSLRGVHQGEDISHEYQGGEGVLMLWVTKQLQWASTISDALYFTKLFLTLSGHFKLIVD